MKGEPEGPPGQNFPGRSENPGTPIDLDDAAIGQAPNEFPKILLGKFTHLPRQIPHSHRPGQAAQDQVILGPNHHPAAPGGLNYQDLIPAPGGV